MSFEHESFDAESFEDVGFEQGGSEDVVGLDRLARSMLRTIARMPTATLVGVHGSPGSSKEIFLRRLAWLATDDNAAIGDGRISPFLPRVAWFNPWLWSKQGDVVAGLVHSVARLFRVAPSSNDRYRDAMAQVNRLRLDGGLVETTGTAVGESSPVERLIVGFAGMVEALRGNFPGRLLIFVEELDRLSPARRWGFLEGVHLLLAGEPHVTVIVGVGREATVGAVRAIEGDISEDHCDRVLERVFDLAVTVPNLEVRRITSLLRKALAPSEGVVRYSFGNDAIQGLCAAVAHRQLGSPRFLDRLSTRVTLLAEYAQEMRIQRELSEAQWAWVIVSVRWPSFRRFMIRGGRDRWIELREVAGFLARPSGSSQPAPRTAIIAKLQEDLILADYLRLHAPGFASDTEGIFWLENLMLAAGV